MTATSTGGAATSPKSPTDRPLTSRGLRTKAALVRAASEVFARDGFNAARITDIADLAGVAHGTFYTYFDSKEQIFGDVILEARQAMLSGPSAAESERGRPVTPRESIRRANERYLTGYRANYRLMVVWEQAATIHDEFEAMLRDSRERFTERSERWIKELQAEGVAASTLDPHYAAVALGAMVSKFAYIWFSGHEQFDFDTAVEQLTALWCNALGLDD